MADFVTEKGERSLIGRDADMIVDIRGYTHCMQIVRLVLIVVEVIPVVVEAIYVSVPDIAIMAIPLSRYPCRCCCFVCR